MTAMYYFSDPLNLCNVENIVAKRTGPYENELAFGNPSTAEFGSMIYNYKTKILTTTLGIYEFYPHGLQFPGISSRILHSSQKKYDECPSIALTCLDIWIYRPNPQNSIGKMICISDPEEEGEKFLSQELSIFPEIQALDTPINSVTSFLTGSACAYCRKEKSCALQDVNKVMMDILLRAPGYFGSVERKEAWDLFSNPLIFSQDVNRIYHSNRMVEIVERRAFTEKKKPSTGFILGLDGIVREYLPLNHMSGLCYIPNFYELL